MIITSDKELRSIIPNIQASAQTEPAWITRLTPFIESAEYAMHRYLAEKHIIAQDEARLKMAKRFVAFLAWYQAIPSLNLVATPNGFGVVSTNIVAPASQERVQEARQAAYSSASQAAVEMLAELHKSKEWLKSPQSLTYANIFPCPRTFAQYHAALNQPLNTQHSTLNTTHYTLNTKHSYPPFFLYLTFRTQIYAGSLELRKYVLGYEAYNRLIELAYAENINEDVIHPEEAELLAACRSFVITVVAGNPSPVAVTRHRFDMLSYLDSYEGPDRLRIIEAWKQSEIYKAFKDGNFQNKKNSSGYFF